MKRIIILAYHGTGHFNACFGLAKALQAEHEVWFAGMEFFQKYVEAQGFYYYPLQTLPFGLGFETWVNKTAKSKHLYLHTLRDRWTNRLYKQRAAELAELLHALSPDIILIDSLQSTDLIILSPLLPANVKTAFFNVMPSNVLQPGLPPINSLALPGDVQGIRKGTRDFKRKKMRKKWSQRINYFGMDDSRLIKRMIHQNNLSPQSISPLLTTLGIVFNHIPEYIITPREFEFPEATPLPFQQHIGFLPNHTRHETADNHYRQRETLLKERKQQNHKIIYGSFGTVQAKDLGPVGRFIKELILAIQDTDYELILSLPAGYTTDAHMPANVHCFKKVPQLRVLTLADVFITHGGINSIKESVYAGVPMLVYPLDPNFDQYSNSSRIVYHHLGLRGDLMHDTKEDILNKLKELHTNDMYRNNIATLREKDSAYTVKGFINKLLTNG